MRNRPVLIAVLVIAVLLVVAGLYSFMQADQQNVEEEPDAGMIAPIEAEMSVA